jgi:hypothetical protein
MWSGSLSGAVDIWASEVWAVDSVFAPPFEAQPEDRSASGRARVATASADRIVMGILSGRRIFPAVRGMETEG